MSSTLGKALVYLCHPVPPEQPQAKLSPVAFQRRLYARNFGCEGVSRPAPPLRASASAIVSVSWCAQLGPFGHLALLGASLCLRSCTCRVAMVRRCRRARTCRSARPAASLRRSRRLDCEWALGKLWCVQTGPHCALRSIHSQTGIAWRRHVSSDRRTARLSSAVSFRQYG